MYDEPRYKFFKKDKLIYLADFCFHCPCNTYLHLAYGIRSGILQPYKFVTDAGLVNKDEIETHLIPAKHLPHEDICTGYSQLMLLEKDVKRLKRRTAKFSKYSLDDFRKYDFCSPYNIGKIAPQLAYIIAYSAKVEPETDFSPDEVREVFYSKEDKFYSRFPGIREEWELPVTQLWTKRAFVEANIFSDKFLEKQARELLACLMRSGLHGKARLGYLLDFFFPPLHRGGFSNANKEKLFAEPGDNIVEHGSYRKRWSRQRKENMNQPPFIIR